MIIFLPFLYDYQIINLQPDKNNKNYFFETSLHLKTKEKEMLSIPQDIEII